VLLNVPWHEVFPFYLHASIFPCLHDLQARKRTCSTSRIACRSQWMSRFSPAFPWFQERSPGESFLFANDIYETPQCHTCVTDRGRVAPVILIFAVMIDNPIGIILTHLHLSVGHGCPYFKILQHFRGKELPLLLRAADKFGQHDGGCGFLR